MEESGQIYFQKKEQLRSYNLIRKYDLDVANQVGSSGEHTSPGNSDYAYRGAFGTNSRGKKMLRLEKDILQYSDTQTDCTPKALNVIHLIEHLRAKEINHYHGRNRTPSIMQISEG